VRLQLRPWVALTRVECEVGMFGTECHVILNWCFCSRSRWSRRMAPSRLSGRAVPASQPVLGRGHKWPSLTPLMLRKVARVALPAPLGAHGRHLRAARASAHESRQMDRHLNWQHRRRAALRACDQRPRRFLQRTGRDGGRAAW